LYQTAEEWKDFTNIEEFTSTAIEQPKDAASRVFYDGASGVIQWNGTVSAVVKVLDLNGVVRFKRTVAAGEAVSIGNLPKGVYLVNAVAGNVVCTEKVRVN